LWQTKNAACGYLRIASTNKGDPMQPRIPPSGSPRAYRVNDFCRLYGIGRSGVYKLLKEGKLPSVIIAGRRVIPRDAAEALLRGDDK
jgi:hypothetical protein